MVYHYTVGIKEKGRRYRKAKVTAKSDAELKRACNALLTPGAVVTILKKKGGKHR